MTLYPAISRDRLFINARNRATLQEFLRTCFIYKSLVRFPLMDLELTPLDQSWATIFQPLKPQFASPLNTQKFLLENSFSLVPNSSQSHLLLTLFPNAIIARQMSSSAGQHLNVALISFQLKFELIYQVEKNVRSGKKGIRFFYDETRSVTLYSNSSANIEAWAICLGQFLNQLGFHQMFKPLKKLGKGNFASVYEVQRITDGRKFAVKAFSKQACFSAKNGKQSLMNELSIMRHLSLDSHSNVLQLQSVYQSQNSIYVVLELLTGGQLFHRIQERNGIFTPMEIKQFMVGLLDGLRRLHSQRIMHRDLKPENIMIRGRDSMTPVIVDYGLATFADVEKYLFYRCGTPGYVAPQIIHLTENGHVEPECDVFSAGVMFHILLTKKPLFEGSRYDEVYKRNKEMQFNLNAEAYQHIDKEAMILLRGMLQADPTKRISALQALQHPYFYGITRGEDDKVSSPVATSVSQRKMHFIGF